MRINIEYDKLVSNLDYVSAIVDDNFMAQELKNFIFQIGKDSLSIITYNPNTVSICKTHLTDMDYTLELGDEELPNGYMYLQLKAKELSTFLGTFKSLMRTKPTTVEIETLSLKVRVTVYEEALSPEDTKLNRSSKWVFDNIPLKGSVMKEITMEVPKEKASSLSSDELLLYTSSMFPLLSNEGANNLPSKLHFGEKYVLAVNVLSATLFENMLPEAFRGVVLTYPTINFLQRMLSGVELFNVVKTDSHIMVFTDKVEAVFRYQIKMPDVEIYLKNADNRHAIVLDRKYLRDVIKRLSIVNEQIHCEVDLEEGELLVKNTKFSQGVPLLATKGIEEIGKKVSFKLSAQVLNRVIIGDDNAFPDDIRIYLVPASTTGYTLYFSDSTGKWFSTIQVR